MTISKVGRLTLIRRLEGLTGHALNRLERIIQTGGDKEALEAAKVVLARTMPEPKVNTAAEARQIALAAQAGASAGVAAIAVKAQARLVGPAPDATDAPFEPVRTLGKGVKG